MTDMSPNAVAERIRAQAQLRLYAPEAVTRRLKQVAELRALCMRLQQAVQATSNE